MLGVFCKYNWFTRSCPQVLLLAGLFNRPINSSQSHVWKEMKTAGTDCLKYIVEVSIVSLPLMYFTTILDSILHLNTVIISETLQRVLSSMKSKTFIQIVNWLYTESGKIVLHLSLLKLSITSAPEFCTLVKTPIIINEAVYTAGFLRGLEKYGIKYFCFQTFAHLVFL